MRAYTVRIEETRMRHQRLVAHSEDAARRAASLLLRSGDKIVGVQMSEVSQKSAYSPDEGRRALKFLLARSYLPKDDAVMTLRDWVDYGGYLDGIDYQGVSKSDALDDANAALALCGLRLLPGGDLLVGSPVSIPALCEWLGATAWGGSKLLPVLGSLPGTTRSLRTFAGIRSRVVVIPASEVFA